MANEYKIFESLININMCDKDATITGCELYEKYGSIYVLVNYTVTDEYAKENDLYYKNRTMEILLKRGEINKGIPVSSYAHRMEG